MLAQAYAGSNPALPKFLVIINPPCPSSLAVEHPLGKGEVTGPIPVLGSIIVRSYAQKTAAMRTM